MNETITSDGRGGFSREPVPAEQDPHGFAASTPGAKLDHGKLRYSLVLGSMARAIHAVTEVGEYGAGKYSENGWRDVPDGANRYTDALLRHLQAELRGEAVDSDSGLAHAAQTAWNALARLELLLRPAAQTPDLGLLDAPSPERSLAGWLRGLPSGSTPRWARWAGRDANGNIWFFETRPLANSDRTRWVSQSGNTELADIAYCQPACADLFARAPVTP